MATLIPGDNSYVDLDEANNIADEYIQAPQWNTLDDESKIRYLLTAYRVMNSLEGFEASLVTTPENLVCLKRSQVEIALNDMQYGISVGEFNQQEVKLEKAGPVEMEYYQTPTGFKEPTIIPESTWPCLEIFGAIKPEESSGIYTINKTRY